MLPNPNHARISTPASGAEARPDLKLEVRNNNLIRPTAVPTGPVRVNMDLSQSGNQTLCSA
jgi:hypothetical protein